MFRFFQLFICLLAQPTAHHSHVTDYVLHVLLAVSKLRVSVLRGRAESA